MEGECFSGTGEFFDGLSGVLGGGTVGTVGTVGFLGAVHGYRYRREAVGGIPGA
ncbi:hypothetical protein [Corynebacterium propinquum]|uniref:hypothetical protein n=1 Tax=Corynebacterium propinquum TaxID=43769 RepID=UPI00345F036E